MPLKDMSLKAKIWTIVGGIATLGGAVAGINAVASSSYRPVLKSEVEHVLPAENYQRVQIAGEQRIKDLNVEQLQIKKKVLDSERREFRRELFKSKERADTYRQQQEAVPDWLLEDIANTESRIQEIDGDKSTVETQMIELRGSGPSD
jgi:hypothetical protein